MKYCSKCGKEIMDEAVVCPFCGCSVAPIPTADNKDAPNMGFGVLGFFIPIVGFILYLIWREKTPLKAKSAGMGALIGFVANIAFSILYAIFIGSVIGSIFDSISTAFYY